VPDGDALLRAIELGARGALSVTCEGGELMAAVRRVASGDAALSRAQTQQVCMALRDRPRAAATERISLTPRELQIVRSIEAGELIKQTARALGISPRTVENTQRVLFRKLGVRNRAQAIARAHALGIVEPLAEVRA
jgi:DNA-binding NarL/FixJ family response regulator